MAVAAQAARREAPTVEAAGRARAERTTNMYLVFVTLDVSKLSGWLNLYAYCRVERRAIWEEVYGPGGVRAADDCGARNVQGKARLQIGGRAWGGAHFEHVAHGCDAGGVPVGYIRVEP